MQTPTPQRSLAKAWLFRSILIAVVLLIVGAILLLVRGRAESTDVKQPGLVTLPKPKSGYQNRAIRQHDAAQGPRPEIPKLRGIVYDISGKPVEGARVAAATFQIAGNQSTVAAAAESDSHGKFEMSLPDGTYYLSGEKKGYGPTIAIARGGEEVGLVLRKSGEVTGHVKDERGQPIRHFSIDVIAPTTDDMAAPAPFVSREFNAEDGSYRISELPREGVFLRATAAGYAPSISSIVTVGEDKSETVDLTLGTGCVLTGTVVESDGTPLADVHIDAELRRTAGVMGATSIDAASQAESDNAGRFRLENVPKGGVLVRAYDGTHAVSAVELNIESCDGLTPVRVEMVGGSTLSGVVKDSDEKPLPGARITLSNRGTGFVETTADASGRYRFEKLPPGGMRIEALAGSQRTMLLVNVSASVEVEQDILFGAEGKGEIRGKVTAGGTPLPGIQLTLVVNGGKGTLATRHPVTGADGSYRATGLPDGVYAVLVPTAGQIVQAKVDNGSAETVDIDVSFVPKPQKMPERPPPGSKLRDRAGADDGASSTSAPAAQDDSPSPRDDVN